MYVNRNKRLTEQEKRTKLLQVKWQRSSCHLNMRQLWFLSSQALGSFIPKIWDVFFKLASNKF